jgi:hypothetical protein
MESYIWQIIIEANVFVAGVLTKYQFNSIVGVHLPNYVIFQTVSSTSVTMTLSPEVERKNERLVSYFRGSLALRAPEHCSVGQIKYTVSQIQKARCR